MANQKKVMIGFKTDPEVKERLESIAYEEDRSVSYVVNRILTKELTESQKALQVLDYIESMEYTSYTDFVKKAIADNKYNWIRKDFGELQAYFIVCEKLGVMPSEEVASTLST